MPQPSPAIPTDLPRSLACHGNAADINAWSSIPYFLFHAAKPRGFLTDALDLTDPAYRRRRLSWSAMAPLRLERAGGYQYSPAAIEHMWQRVPPELRRGEIISHYQLFPPLDRATDASVRHSFYCDATLTLLFKANWPGMNTRATIGHRTRADALRREGALYRAARFCVGMSRSTADSFINDYGVNPANVVVVRPGANLDEPQVRNYLQRRGPSWRERPFSFTPENPARLGFIGREYLRKGLPRLVEASEILHSRGRPVRVTVIGHCPEHLRTHPLVEWKGFIHKSQDTPRFLVEVDTFAIGCLPSYDEPLGISTLECLRLGIPVLGADVGGIPDCVPPQAGVLVPRLASGGDIADALEALLFDEERYRAAVRGAVANMEQVTWDAAVSRLIQTWAGDISAAPDPPREQGTGQRRLS
jgi:glycosyltransferase involved in cell wall biosynthesis